jgi:DNA-binding transcriptional MerR regulator
VTPKLYKAADVCEIAGLQPYVLRSWEKEFPGIGVQKSPENARLYRQADVDQVLRIKQLVFGEGLTLAGARRKLEAASPAPAHTADAEMAEVLDTLGADVRTRIATVRNGLRSILEALSNTPGAVAIAELRTAVVDGNGGRALDQRRGSAKIDRGVGAAGRADTRNAKAAGPRKRSRAKAAVAAKRPVATKRKVVSRKARGAKRKRASA